MTNLDRILKSRDITFPKKVHLVKAMVFPGQSLSLLRRQLPLQKDADPPGNLFYPSSTVPSERSPSPLRRLKNTYKKRTAEAVRFFIIEQIIFLRTLLLLLQQHHRWYPQEGTRLPEGYRVFLQEFR